MKGLKMMIHAYQETYLSNVQSLLAEAFEYGVNTCDISGQDFMKIFSISKTCKGIENGDIPYLFGKSGIELAIAILEDAGLDTKIREPIVSYKRTAEYWMGFVLAYYQWYSNRKFEEIFYCFSFNDLKIMYQTFHETDISKFVEIVDKKIRETLVDTNLKRMRLLYGVSQSKLAKLSGVSLRSIQMYEQRNKNINKASGETLYCLSKTLGCSMEALLEH